MKNKCHAEFISPRESFGQHLLNRKIPKQVRNDEIIFGQVLKGGDSPFEVLILECSSGGDTEE